MDADSTNELQDISIAFDGRTIIVNLTDGNTQVIDLSDLKDHQPE